MRRVTRALLGVLALLGGLWGCAVVSAADSAAGLAVSAATTAAGVAVDAAGTAAHVAASGVRAVTP